MSNYHVPVLLKESVEGLVIDKSGIYVDVTFGGGGHSRAILELLTENGQLIGFDQDEDSKKNIITDNRFEFVESNFKYLKNFLKMMAKIPVHGVLADLGVSSHQFNQAERGFSLRFDGPLDMRMAKGLKTNAASVLNTYSEEQLVEVFRNFGEVNGARRLAQAVVSTREYALFKSTFQLTQLVQDVFNKKQAQAEMPKIFQAIRIEVNQELEVLKDFLHQSLEVLKQGGRLVIISYHSLEDRLVKNFFRTGNFEGKVEKDFYGNLIRPLQPIFSKAIVPSANEIALNPRSRSAKLRIAEKL